MSRVLPQVPRGPRSRGKRRASPHTSQSDVVPEQEMHAEHVAALEKTLFRKRKPTLVLSLESGRLRLLSKPADRLEPSKG